MLTTRRGLTAAAASIATVLALTFTPAAADDAADLSNAIESLRKAMQSADKAGLEAATAENLSYGHSAGKIENKAEFVGAIMARKAVVKSLQFTDQKNDIHGQTARSRHFYESVSEEDGKVTNTRIGVLQVWQKQDGKWKLYARQAYKL